MRDDQYIRLQSLGEKLTDQFLFEADPVNWPADGVHPKDMTQEDRGNRYWCKKNAVATVSLTLRIESLLGKLQGSLLNPATPGAPEGEDAAQGLLDAEIAEAERQAKALLKRMQKATATG